MLGQSKTAFQAEIDSAAELVDFWRFNPHYAQELYAEQPLSSGAMWNQLDYRPLEGFVYAVTPFNFTSIAGNLPTAPALMGNTVVWKPASSAIPSAYYILRLLEAAGLPPGVINFVPGNAADRLRRRPQPPRPRRRPLHRLDRGLQLDVEDDRRRAWTATARYPRIVGETGGKDFIVAHASADPQALAVAVVRGGFEYQGQKCSAASRVYVPRSIWNDVRDRIVGMIGEIRMGDVADFRNFMGAVIDRKAFDEHLRLPRGGEADGEDRRRRRGDGEKGFFVEPTLVETADPGYRLLCEEIFGPVVTVYVYDDAKWAGDAAARRRDLALRAHRRRLRERPRGRPPGGGGAAQRGRQLLRERQADGRGRRPAAVRRRARARARTTRRARSSTSSAG